MVVIARYLANPDGTPRHITALGHHDPAANKSLSDHWRDSLDTITISDGYIGGRGINLQGVDDFMEGLMHIVLLLESGEPASLVDHRYLTLKRFILL
jgi:hypothetical protein